MSWRAFVGVVLLILGVGFLLDQLEVIAFGELLSTWWPLILIAIAVIQLATRSVAPAVSVFLLLAGVYLQVAQLDLLPFDLGQVFWPSLLILAGLYLVLTRSMRRPADANVEDHINSFVIFGGTEQRLESKSFKGGSATALFGGTDIDLRDAALAPEGALLDLTAAFGGIEVVVPEDWKVRMSGLPIFGGWDNKTRRKGDTADGPMLTVRCVAAFGGIELHN
jgi:predicted membrane protein